MGWFDHPGGVDKSVGTLDAGMRDSVALLRGREGFVARDRVRGVSWVMWRVHECWGRDSADQVILMVDERS